MCVGGYLHVVVVRSASNSASTSNLPTPDSEPQLEVVGINLKQMKADTKRYASMFKNHIERLNSHYRVVITTFCVQLLKNENPVYEGPYNVETVKNLLLLSKLVKHNGDEFLKAISANSGVLRNFLTPGDYKSAPTPEVDERLA